MKFHFTFNILLAIFVLIQFSVCDDEYDDDEEDDYDETNLNVPPSPAPPVQVTTASVTDNNNPPNLTHHDDQYDFIIVGAGPSGCALANRLSEKWKVLLIEAGHFPTLSSHFPLITNYLQETEFNWDFITEPQTNACLGMKGKRCRTPAGKGVGGSTIINSMIYSRGNKYDFYYMHKRGYSKWSWRNVLPYFKKFEKMTIDTLASSETHGTDGPVNIEYPPYKTKLADAFIEANKAMGLDEADYNSGTHLNTVSQLQSFTKNGRRVTAFSAYIQPILRRENFKIMQNTHVKRVLIDDNKNAYGVEVTTGHRHHREKHGRTMTIQATKEVILSAGSFNSAKLLMLSGIGPNDVLQKAGIQQIKSLPVGQNFYDHVMHHGPVVLLDSNLTPFPKLKLFSLRNIHRTMERDGASSIPNGIEAVNFIRVHQDKTRDVINDADITEAELENSHSKLTNQSDEILRHRISRKRPNIEILFTPTSFHTDRGIGLRKAVGLRDEIYESVYEQLENYEHDVFMALPILLHPKSKGSITLKDSNPFSKPIIQPNYLTEEKDVERLLGAIKFVVSLIDTEPFKELGARLHDAPLPTCFKYTFGSDDYWRCSIRTMTSTVHHQSGACRMGFSDETSAVVSTKLKVHGIKYLRVADDSVMPFTVSSHLTATAYMIGEKAAHLIQHDWEPDTDDDKI